MEVLFLVSVSDLTATSILCRFLRKIRAAWAHSRIYRWLRSEPFWLGAGPSSLIDSFLLALYRPVQPLVAAGRVAVRESRLLALTAEKAWLLLFMITAYPLIDFALRRGGDPGGLAGGCWDEILLFLGLLLIAGRLFYRGIGAWRPSELGLPLYLFYGIFIFLALVRSPETGVAAEGARVYLEYLLWFFVALNLPDRTGQVKTLTAFFVATCTAVALYGIGQYIAGVPVPQSWIDQAEAGVRTRAFSVIGSPNVLGSFLALALPLAVAGFLTAGSRISRASYAVASTVIAICFLVTFSRGAWLAAFLGLVLFAAMTRPMLLAFLITAAFAAPAVSPGIAGRLLYLFSSGYLVSSQRSGRIARWQAALDKLWQHPLTGEGLGRFGGAVAARAIPGSFYVDNFYLKTAAETGFIGLGALFFLLVSAWRAGYRACAALVTPAEKTLAVALLSGLTAVLLHNLVENIFETPLMSTLFWVFLGLLVALPRLATEQAPK
ncbi:O-antigen ligase family protein [Thermodesulfitimonas sp.]